MNAATASLEASIAQAKKDGLTDEDILAQLKAGGRPTRRILLAFLHYYEGAQGITLPAALGWRERAGAAVLSIGAYVSLIAWVAAAIELWALLIWRWLPVDLLTFEVRQPVYTLDVAELATIAVAFPVFLFLSRAIATQVRQRSQRFDSVDRTRLTSLFLVFVACATLASMSIFGWGAALVVVAAVLIFLYYLSDLRAQTPIARNRVYAGIAVVAVAVSLAFGIVDIGAPIQARAAWHDGLSTDALRVIRWRLYDRYTDAVKHKRPIALPAVIDVRTFSKDERDALESPVPFSYTSLGASRYRLCTTFEYEGDPADSGYYGPDLAHGPGRACFTLDARVEPAR